MNDNEETIARFGRTGSSSGSFRPSGEKSSAWRGGGSATWMARLETSCRRLGRPGPDGYGPIGGDRW